MATQKQKPAPTGTQPAGKDAPASAGDASNAATTATVTNAPEGSTASGALPTSEPTAPAAASTSTLATDMEAGSASPTNGPAEPATSSTAAGAGAPLARVSSPATPSEEDPDVDVDPPSPTDLVPPLPEYPRRGDKLRCDNFEGSTVVIAQVERTVYMADDPDTFHVVVWIPALRRHWPVYNRTIKPPLGVTPYGTWTYVEQDYPLSGADPMFDASFRAIQVEADEAPKPPPVVTFRPPRRPRAGHCWARILEPVDALGFTLEGTEKKRGWLPSDGWAELMTRAVESAPNAFERLS